MGDGENTLSKNTLNNFILRVDFVKTDVKLAPIVEKMSVHFDRTEKKQISGITVKFTQGDSEFLPAEKAFDFVLISKENTLTLTFSEVQNAFWIQCNNYIDNSIYKDIVRNIIEVMKIVSPDIESRRIGLRYINEFKCNNPKNISKIYSKRLAAITKQMVNKPGLSRIIGMEEYNNDGYKLRFQYGIPNKFYPSVITVYDLVMDIDSFIESTSNVDEWEEIIRNLNHAAYEIFKHEMNQKYLEELK